MMETNLLLNILVTQVVSLILDVAKRQNRIRGFGLLGLCFAAAFATTAIYGARCGWNTLPLWGEGLYQAVIATAAAAGFAATRKQLQHKDIELEAKRRAEGQLVAYPDGRKR